MHHSVQTHSLLPVFLRVWLSYNTSKVFNVHCINCLFDEPSCKGYIIFTVQFSFHDNTSPDNVSCVSANLFFFNIFDYFIELSKVLSIVIPSIISIIIDFKCVFLTPCFNRVSSILLKFYVDVISFECIVVS